MPAITPTLEVLDKFISIAKELTKLPALVLPQYQPAAHDLYEICQKLLTANENLSRWLYKFLYFDFRQQDARTKFLDLVRDYKTMKQGPEFRQLKFSCGDISAVYYRNIDSKIGSWFSNQGKLEEAQGIFTKLTDADNDMVAFTYDHVVGKLDNGVDSIEKHVEAGVLNDAEDVRLQIKADMREVTEHLEKFSGELSDLVIRFANIARVPVTLG
jgi:hypothetical protein